MKEWTARGEHAWRDHGLRFTVHEGCVHSTTTRPETGQEQDSHSRVPAYAAGGSGQASAGTMGQSQRALQ